MPNLVTANVITDATRAAGIEGDGRSPTGGSYGFWEAATNLCTNGNANTNTTGWISSAQFAVSRTTEQAKFGTTSFKSTTLASTGTGLGVYSVTLTAAQYFGSMWVYVPAAYDGTALNIAFNGFTAPTVPSTVTSVNMALRDQWQRVSCSITPAAGDLAGDLRLQYSSTAPSVGTFVYFGGVQIELNPLATPYVNTTSGTASRGNARIQVPYPNVLSAKQGWVASRIRPGWAYNASPTTYPRIFDANVNGSNGVHMFYNTFGGAIKWALKTESGGVNEQTDSQPQDFVAGDVLTVIGAWTVDELSISVDGSTFDSLPRAAPPPDLSSLTTFDIGREQWQDTSHFDGDFLWVACGLGTLTDADAAAMNAFGNTPPYLGQLPSDTTMAWRGFTDVYQKAFPPQLMVMNGGGKGNLWRYR